MKHTRKVSVLLAIMLLFVFASACGSKDDHWGQDLNIKKKWWKKEGQSWDKQNNIFMVIGYSNPNWSNKYDLRKSADLDARAQAAAFMSSLVKNYMEETRSNNYSLSESVVRSTADEMVLGSVVVARKYYKKQYLSLIKVDLGYFFSQVYKGYRNEMEQKMRVKMKDVPPEKLDEMIQTNLDSSLEKLKGLEAPAVEKSLPAQY